MIHPTKMVILQRPLNHLTRTCFVPMVMILIVEKTLAQTDISGELCADESKRRLLPSKAWDILLQYFPKAVLYKAGAPACSICLVGVDFT